MKIFVYPQGTRVRLRRGAFPLDPGWIGRQGIVVKVDEYRPGRYGVVLEGESAPRDFAEDEMEAIEPGAAPREAGSSGHAAS